MKKVDDTPLPKSESEQMFEHVSAAVDELNAILSEQLDKMNERLEKLEKELALMLEQRETVRAPECQEDPEWY